MRFIKRSQSKQYDKRKTMTVIKIIISVNIFSLWTDFAVIRFMPVVYIHLNASNWQHLSSLYWTLHIASLRDPKLIRQCWIGSVKVKWRHMLHLSRRFNDHMVITTNAEDKLNIIPTCMLCIPCHTMWMATENEGRKVEKED